MENCCLKCRSTEGLKRYYVTECGYIVSESEMRRFRFFSIAQFIRGLRIKYSDYFCPKCAKSGEIRFKY